MNGSEQDATWRTTMPRAGAAVRMALTASAACLCATATPAAAEQTGTAIPTFSIARMRLADALQELSRISDTDILLSPEIDGSTWSRPVNGRMSTDDAVKRLLSGTTMTARRTSDGAILVSPGAPVSIPDILVVGRRTQNLDIPRTRDDIQPYRVAGSRDIARAHVTSVDDYLHTRTPGNAQALAVVQDPLRTRGSPRSEVDLHGLGSDQTVVLVDGGRLPRVPTSRGDLYQPDLNGLPPDALDRMEILPLTAGGIYGPDAIGGVVNAVVRRSASGAEATVQSGPPLRDGGSSRRLFARVALSPDEGRTTVEMMTGLSRQDGLLWEDRAFPDRARALGFARLPPDVLATVPTVDGVIVRSRSGNLALRSASGTVDLGAPFAVLPVGTGGASATSLDRSPASVFPGPGGEAGGARSLTTTTRTRSILVDVHHRLTARLEIFADLIALRNEGTALQPADPLSVQLPRSSPASPFEQDVVLGFLPPAARDVDRTRLDTSRLTIGVIANLGSSWRGEGHVALGAASMRRRRNHDIYDGAAIKASVSSGLGTSGRRALAPLGDWNTFRSAIDDYRTPAVQVEDARNRLSDFSVRMAGPLLRLPGGDAMLTLYAEQREESLREPRFFTSADDLPSYGPDLRAKRQRTSSAYAEILVPILAAAESDMRPRAEVQLATRYDDVGSLKRWVDENGEELHGGEAGIAVDQATIVYTGGLRAAPLPWLSLRASVATGAAPTPFGLIGPVSLLRFGPGERDPKRPGRPTNTEAPVSLTTGAARGARPEHADSLALGAVLAPFDSRSPRISLDFIRIRRSRQIDYSSSGEFVLAREGASNVRVARDPLSASDLSLGFTGGVVTAIDATNIATGRTEVDTIDADVEHDIDTPIGAFRILASGTWTTRFRRRASPLQPWYSKVGTPEGPVRWRGNVSTDWRRGSLELSASAQMVGSYRLTYNPDFGGYNALVSSIYDHAVPPQVYLDLAGRLALGRDRLDTGRGLELRVGVINVFDRAPPLVPYEIGYSSYGDARLRRLDVVLVGRF
ncbi:TonB-dependent receptor domain-containing protein [Sphingomonas sp. DT-51]|uniref:TonB-dependent receptor domain-containing protein n=1 Tax=Sphingomonas sp. DT-51 TaxID=3396165 RepID=UPI003F1BC5CF